MSRPCSARFSADSACGHLNLGLLYAHGMDEGGDPEHPEAGGAHDAMWFAARDLVFGKDGPDPKVQRGLESAAGFLRNALSRSLMIRHTPNLTFELDTSIEHGVRLTRLIDSISQPAKSDDAEG